MAFSDEDTDLRGHPFDSGILADTEERAVVFAVLDSFRQYRKTSHYNTTHRRRQNLYALPEHQRNILISAPFDILDTLSAVDDAIDYNADIADAILNLSLRTFALPENPSIESNTYWHGTAKPGDMAKAHSTIRQFYRDWSQEGFAAETKPLLELIRHDCSPNIPTPSMSYRPTILLPGAGLGRLLFELSLLGYEVEGNEISWHQLLASNFILNTIDQAEQYKLCPFSSTFTNNISRRNQLSMVKIPDIHPSTTVAQRLIEVDHGAGVMGSMNMTAGDFITSYATDENKQSFDCVATIYFIDTAPNLFRYIETINHCLKDAGLWINIGPLLWHFDDRRMEPTQEVDDQGRHQNIDTDTLIEDTGIAEPGSFELTDEEVISLVKMMGFELVKHEYLSQELGGYIQDPNSMIQNRYRCSHWVFRKTTGVDRAYNRNK